MTQVSAAPATVTLPSAAAPRPSGHRSTGPEGRALEFLLQAQPEGRLVTSLSLLAGNDTLPAVQAARRAVARLDDADYAVSVDARAVAVDAPLEICWTPAIAIVDLLLDWDLPELEITIAELAVWLDVHPAVARRAVGRLGRYPGVAVDWTAADEAVVVRMDVEACPLTSARFSA